MASDTQFCLRCGGALAPFVEEERERLRCTKDGCGFVFYGNPTPVVAAIVQDGDDVILIRQHGWPEKFLGLVTGFLERGETPEAGVLRELREELGLEGTVERLVGVYSFPQRNELIVAYHVRASGPLALGAEILEAKRVPIARLRPWPFGTGEAVRDWLASR